MNKQYNIVLQEPIRLQTTCRLLQLQQNILLQKQVNLLQKLQKQFDLLLKREPQFDLVQVSCKIMKSNICIHNYFITQVHVSINQQSINKLSINFHFRNRQIVIVQREHPRSWNL
ncbi:Hypothetical_protein [Hexamita inflata]|uniref:Hypothetical_protein n=1 Tax=Hexamita inflata TaxID=28002 RepID=A0ABP1JI51_9EUKA